jgi:DNA (cytosine-5)-methyltransferase 1
MTHGSLFSGIGGFDLAAEWAGWDNIFHCEWNKFGQQVLKYHFPNSITYENIKTTDFTIHKKSIDVLSGGFPCQPYSSAGKRLGKEDERHLWPEMLRAIREIRPRWVVGENVRGLTNWNGGVVFDEVQFDLEIEGYEVIPFLLPACAVNAPHRRDRIWFIAYSNCNGLYQCNRKHEKYTSKRGKHAQCNTTKSIFNENATNSDNLGLEYSRKYRKISEKKSKEKNGENKFTISFETNDFGKFSKWRNFPTQSPICRGDDGISKKLDGITFSKWRKESIKAYGNAIVPQVAFEIFKAINLYENTINNIRL